MDLRDAIRKAGQILDQERAEPTVNYDAMGHAPDTAAALGSLIQTSERGTHPRRVRENPQEFQFRSTNFDLLNALIDQVSETDKLAVFVSLSARISNGRSFSHKPGPVLGAGSWRRCSSELPLVTEFLVRCGHKTLFMNTLGKAAPSPGLTLLLLQLEEMIALNFTLFTEEEYARFPSAIGSIGIMIADVHKPTAPSSTLESNTMFHVVREVPELCHSVLEECRKAEYLYVKSLLQPGVNLEINQDKSKVRTFLEKLGFTKLLIDSLDEAERLYRASTSPFDLKSSMGHLRSFLEQLHLEACAAVHRKFGGSLPSKWGEALRYLRDHDVLTKQEELFSAQFYTLTSDTGVHPLIAEQEYARLMRNMSIECGLLLLTKLDKLGLN
jgi:hypothetical protein